MEDTVQQPPVEGGVPPVEAPVAAPTQETPAAPDPKDLHAVVKHATETKRGTHAQHQPRTERGQFDGPPKVPPVPAAPPRPPLPKSLKQDLAPHWEKTPAELAAAIIEREAAYEKGVEPLKLKAREAEALLNEFKPYEHLMRAEGATPQAAIRNFLQTAAIFRQGTPQQKVQAVQQLMHQFGIPVEALTQQAPLQGGPAPQVPYDPRFDVLQQQLQQLTTAQQQRAQSDEASRMALVDQFASQNKHFPAVADQILVLLQHPEVLGPGVELKSESEKLQAAYDYAIWQNPEVRKQVLAEQQAKEAAERAAADAANVAKARNAAVQVTGAPSAGPAPKVDPKDLHAVIGAAFRQQR